MPPFIELCVETIARHNPEFTLTTPDSISAMSGGADMLATQAAMPTPHRSDVVRLWLILQHGGAWTDTDCIALRRLDIADRLGADDQVIGVYNGHRPRRTIATPWAAPPNSPAVKYMLDRVVELNRKKAGGTHVPYGATSVGTLSATQRSGRFKFSRLPGANYNRITWDRAHAIFMQEATDEEHARSKHVNEEIQIYHLTNVVPAAYKKSTVEEILTARTFAAYLLRRGLGMV